MKDLYTIPGNEVCADCNASKPKWARSVLYSWSCPAKLVGSRVCTYVVAVLYLCYSINSLCMHVAFGSLFLFVLRAIYVHASAILERDGLLVVLFYCRVLCGLSLV